MMAVDSEDVTRFEVGSRVSRSLTKPEQETHPPGKKRLEMRINCCLFITLCLVIFSGCGEESPLVNVSGKVTLGGKPLVGAAVTFQPVSEDQEAPSSFGKTDEEGKYTLETATGETGAIPGPHTVRISKSQGEEEDSDEILQFPNLVPDEYRLKGVSFTVPEDGTSEANFDIPSGKD